MITQYISFYITKKSTVAALTAFFKHRGFFDFISNFKEFFFDRISNCLIQMCVCRAARNGPKNISFEKLLRLKKKP